MPIESQKLFLDVALFELSFAAAERINDIAQEFEENDNEIETGAREAFGEVFRCILAAYNFKVDMEGVTVPRE